MSSREILRREFDAEEGSFLLQARVSLKWDWDAFRRLTSAMYDVADEAKGQPCQRTVKTSHFEGRIASTAADAALGRDERTQRELTAFDFDFGGAWLVPPADCA
jgi:hypothetical protein